MAIGMIVILFVGLCVISILGTLLLLLVKSEKAKRKIFYAMSVWGMAVAVLSATSLPTNYTAQQIAAWALGFLSVAGIVVHVKAKEKMQLNIACALVIVSCLGGVVKMFLI